MYHIHIIHSPKDRGAAFLLSRRLKWYYRTHKQIGPARVHLGDSQFSHYPDERNFLVILCSFHTVHDPDIAQAILRFHEEAPIAHIIPYTISGIPFAADPADECLPQVLAQISRNDLHAINSVVLTKHAAVQKVISTIHEIPLSQLEQRDKKRARVRNLLTGLLFLAIALYGFRSEYTTGTHTEYYRSYTYSRGVVTGIDRMNSLERLFADDYYLLRVHYQSPLSIQRIGDPRGAWSEDPELQAFLTAIDSPKVVFSYQTDGALDAAVHMTEDEQILFVMHYSAENTAVDFSLQTDGITPYFLTLNGEQTRFSRCLLEYDSLGNLTGIRYRVNSRNQETQ